MNISNISGSPAQNMYQLQNQKAGHTAPQKMQQVSQQGSSEENRESGAEKIREARSGGESKETGSINVYA